MIKNNYITIRVNRKDLKIDINEILYIIMKEKNAEIHLCNNKIYVSRITCAELSQKLGENFIEIRRGCLVAVMAICNIRKKIELINGEFLSFTTRRRKEISDTLHDRQKNIINNFAEKNIPKTFEEYRNYYISFEKMPFAFTDIEMIFNEQSQAVDWIFCYGNDALAKLEKLPLNKLIGNSFGSLFSNMDSKWLRCYEKCVLFGKTLEMMDYSPEIDRYIKVICFPTFKGHCGCILFDVHDISYNSGSIQAEKFLTFFLNRESESH